MKKIKEEYIFLIETISEFISGKKKKSALSYDSIKDLNWEEILRIAERHKILLTVYNEIYNNIPLKYQAKYDQKYYDKIKEIEVYTNELRRIIQIADQNGIEVILIKGLALSKMIYNNIYARQFNDIDLLVKENDMRKMYGSINEIGYVQHTGYDENTKKFYLMDKPIFKYSEDFHEFQCIKDVGDNTHIFVEIKRASSAVSLKHIDDFHENVQNLSFGNINIKTTNIIYSFMHICSNFFSDFETYFGAMYQTNIRDIVDVCIFLKRHPLDWQLIKLLSDKYEMTHKIYYVLNCITKIVDEVITNEIMDLFNPKLIAYEVIGGIDELGNIAGPINDWETDFVFRLCNDEERKKELVRITKKRIYAACSYKDYDTMEKDTFSVLTDIDKYRYFEISSIGWIIRYLFTYDKENLYLNLYIDSNIYKHLGHYFFLVIFVDNNLENGIKNRTITITKYETLQVSFKDLKESMWQYMGLNDMNLVRVSIPFISLDMNLQDFDGRIFHNIQCREKIESGSEGFKNMGSKYGPGRTVFIKPA